MNRRRGPPCRRRSAAALQLHGGHAAILSPKQVILDAVDECRQAHEVDTKQFCALFRERTDVPRSWGERRRLLPASRAAGSVGPASVAGPIGGSRNRSLGRCVFTDPWWIRGAVSCWGEGRRCPKMAPRPGWWSRGRKNRLRRCLKCPKCRCPCCPMWRRPFPLCRTGSCCCHSRVAR